MKYNYIISWSVGVLRLIYTELHCCGKFSSKAFVSSCVKYKIRNTKHIESKERTLYKLVGDSNIDSNFQKDKLSLLIVNKNENNLTLTRSLHGLAGVTFRLFKVETLINNVINN